MTSQCYIFMTFYFYIFNNVQVIPCDFKTSLALFSEISATLASACGVKVVRVVVLIFLQNN